jgi:hypothetical protein
MTTHTATLFAASFGVVFFLVLQSLFTNRAHYVAAFINSLCFIGPCNLYVIKSLPNATTTADNIAYLLGGPLACVLAMIAFNAYTAKGTNE